MIRHKNSICITLMPLCLIILTTTASYSRTISFAGQEWVVRTGTGGPGPNHWSDSPSSVWVDPNGLHLKIRRVENTWYCAEVYSAAPTRHGMHRFHVASRVDQLDKNVVASPFLYANDSQEVDIEFSTWTDDSGPKVNNAQYVVQPWDTPKNRGRFTVALNGDYSTHYMDWQKSSIRFKSFHGHYTEPPHPWLLMRDWTYTGKDSPPESANLRVHINLWLIRGAAPSNGQEVEFIIKDAHLPAPPSHSLSVNSSGASNLSITSTTGHGGATDYTKTVIDRTNVNLQAPYSVGSGASRMSFNGWTGSLTSSNVSITFTMDTCKTITANYLSAPQSSLSVSVQDQGDITLTTCK